MFGITRLILNLSIGAKLGIASGLGVLLVATMVIVQILSLIHISEPTRPY